MPDLTSLWVASRGGVVQQGTSLTKAVKKQIARFFPGKNVTPLSLRRSIPTSIYRENFKGDCQTLEQYAKIVNTSKDVLLRHYICYYDRQRQASYISKINQRFNENAETRDLQFTIKLVLDISNRIEDLKKKKVDEQQNDQPEPVATSAEGQTSNATTTFDVPLTIAGVHLLEGQTNFSVATSYMDEANEGNDVTTFWADIMQDTSLFAE